MLRFFRTAAFVFTIALGGGAGRPGTVVRPNNAKVDAAPLLFVFTLDSKAELPTAPPPAVPALPPAAPKLRN